MIEPEVTRGGLVLPNNHVVSPKVVLDKVGNQRVQNLMTRSEWERLTAVMRARYFLFRNQGGDYGERMICKTRSPDGTYRGCGQKHMYITDHCIERPFRGGTGLEEGFYLTFRVAHDQVRQRQILTAISKLPDLAKGHPFTARDLAPQDPGENWLAIMISLPEPITKDKATYFADKINQRTGIKYCMIEQCVDFMTANLDCTRGKHSIPPA